MASRARPCAARTRLLDSLPRQTGRCAPPPIAASLLHIQPPKINKIYRNLGLPRQGLFFFPLNHRGYEIGGPCLPPHPSQLRWSFRQYFGVKIVYRYRCDFSLISSYPSLLISSSFLIYESVSFIQDMHINLYKYIYFNSWKIPVWGKRFLFLSWKNNIFAILRGSLRGQTFFDPYFRVKINVYTGAIMLFFSSYLFLFFSSYLFLFFSYYILLLLTYSYLLILKLFVVLQTEKTPRKFQFGKKSAKVYHCLYSSIEQLQVAL